MEATPPHSPLAAVYRLRRALILFGVVLSAVLVIGSPTTAAGAPNPKAKASKACGKKKAKTVGRRRAGKSCAKPAPGPAALTPTPTTAAPPPVETSTASPITPSPGAMIEVEPAQPSLPLVVPSLSPIPSESLVPIEPGPGEPTEEPATESPTGTTPPESTPTNPEPVNPSRGEAGDEGTAPRFYAATSFWNAPVPADAPIDPESAVLTNALTGLVASEEAAKAGPAINTTEWSVPIYTVSASQPLVRVTLEAKNAPALQAAWEAVPIPPSAVPAKGTDGRLIVWQPSTDKLWEFWRATRKADGWHASWGGATQNVSSASGVPDAASWPGAKPWWGASAASMGVVGGLISIEELEKGWINHALQISLPYARAGVFSSPALRTDGHSTDPDSLPEGAHLRIDPNLDLSSLRMPRTTRIIARAAQRYGIFVNNTSLSVSFNAEDPTPTGHDPYHGPSGFFEGKSARVLLATFPWKHLQVLRMNLHSE